MSETPQLREWLAAIEAAHPAEIELGLERVAAVAERMGLLPAPLPVVLIGGTNGKGSTLAYLEAALGVAGHRVGGYSSPHLFRFNERVRLAGIPADDATLIAAFEEVEAARQGVALTYFEFTTLAAMAVFAGEAEVALLEVGLGGRLDAVNVWDPAVSVITSVDLDHQAFLGSDREAIGAEKAGILRSGIPAVCGDPDPPQALIQRADPPLIRLGEAFRIESAGDQWQWVGPAGELGPLPRPRLAGAFQMRNAATAIAAGQQLAGGLRPDAAAWRQALANVLVPGRGQLIPGPVPVWLDVAHNPGAAGELAALLAEQPIDGRTLAVYGAMADKAVAEVGRAMAGVVDRWYPCGMLGGRALSGHQVATRLPVDGGLVDGPFEAPEAALAAARAQARRGRDRIVVFGSFLVVAAALDWLGVANG